MFRGINHKGCAIHQSRTGIVGQRQIRGRYFTGNGRDRIGLTQQSQAAITHEHGNAVQFTDQARVAVERPKEGASLLDLLDGNLDVGITHDVTCGLCA